MLLDGLMFRLAENSLNVSVDLSQAPAAFPKPTSYTWTKNGIQLSGAPPLLTYSTITFPLISRSDAGSYVVSAINFVLGNNSVLIGSDTGSFRLDVICKTFLRINNDCIYCLIREFLSVNNNNHNAHYFVIRWSYFH